AQIAQAELALMQYKTSLREFQSQILAFERNIYSLPIAGIAAETTEVILPAARKLHKDDYRAGLYNRPYGAELIQLLQDIHNLPADRSSQVFRDGVEQCLKNLVTISKAHA